ncbi:MULTISPECIES: cache domain-containing protein [unclassified Oceanobacter]|uniref:cache domain-containing protein n=2 Tax=Gammaproteobacteria TaxID=1236 RepID=UPI0027376D1C|nr:MULTISPECIES: cache domain-containing protein [unclassified Oceanobacter]MDP2608153.1 cache domain-containing protein [Oceanobacter sp. 1_MG-2023]MDP2611185.1 cache domain-containing protein [Oceanobacter sp. 2_MG-2023]
MSSSTVHATSQPVIKAHKARLARQLSLIIRGILLVVFVFVYFYTVPTIKQQVFEIERNSSRLALNNVFEIADQMYTGVEEYRQQALDNHKEQLTLVVDLAENFLQSHFQEAAKQGIPLEQARQTAFAYLRDFTFGNQDYIWVVDHDIQVLSHPDERFQYDGEQQEDDPPQNILTRVVRQAMQDGEGYYYYKWSRIAGDDELDKVSFVRDYPEWGFVIGSGVYLNDIEIEVRQRRQQALMELRNALQEIKVAKTGYMYVFDSNGHMLIHPNDNLDGVTFTTLQNPLSQQPIYQELMAVADTGNELTYRWDKLDDPDNYAYDKLSLVRYIEGFDWYICSSVYLDELQSSADLLSARIMILAGLTMLATLLISNFLVNRITRPLEQLASTALNVQRGDLSARTGIQRDDEVGILASSIDAMVQRLRHNIETLDAQVKQRTEELLATNARVQRMSAVGQLSGGLAHDFNNLLSIIVGNLIVAREHYSASNPELDKLLSPAERAARRGADITHRLLAFSRRQPLQPETVSINTMMTEVLELLHSAFSGPYRLHYRPQQPPLQAWINVDPGHLENALVNLGLNARDAMHDGGTLTYSWKLRDIRQPIEQQFDEIVAPGRYIEIGVADTGTGFSQSALEQAFEPFFSTKEGSNNSGLGLSMVYGFVKQSFGYIQLHNRPQGGAMIRLLLPASDAPANPELNDNDSDNRPKLSPGGLYLLVEDNPDVRAVIRKQLVDLGQHVVEAADGNEAQTLLDDLLASGANPLTGMVSDIMIPGTMNGRKLAATLRRRAPEAVILLVSGYTDDPAQQDQGHDAIDQQDPMLVLLRKPFDRQQLGQALERASTRIRLHRQHRSLP